jgi:K+-transporting ATPase KdpF subunit
MMQMAVLRCENRNMAIASETGARFDDRHRLDDCRSWFFSVVLGIHPGLFADLRSRLAMNVEYLAGGILVVLVTFYLVYALIRPEQF